MQRIIQINIAGRVLPIEEDAYVLLKNYINALERQFTGTDGKEIIEDIESRISELFSTRLQSGAHAIDGADVQKVIDTLGAPADLHDGSSSSSSGYGNTSKTGSSSSGGYNAGYNTKQSQYNNNPNRDRLLRDPFDKMVGGVCSGLAHYFDVDTVIVRLIMLVLILTAGIGLLVYVIAWCIIPAAKTPADLEYGNPMTFHDISHNVTQELTDLQKRGERMSRELQDFFRSKR